MEKIDSDDLLVKILSFLPIRDAVRTSVLSKRWEFLWMWLPKLEFVEDKNMSLCRLLPKEKATKIKCMRLESEKMRRFIDRNLPMHRAPVIETLRLKLHNKVFRPEDIKFWVATAVSRSVHELSVTYCWRKSRPGALLPSCLFICKSLVTLKLEGMICMVVPRVFCLPSLRTLHLRQVSYAAESYFQRLLSNCPVLEDLVVERRRDDSCEALSIIVTSLQRLSLKIAIGCYNNGFLINTPSLKYFKVVDYYDVGDDSDSDSDGDSDRASLHSTNDSEFGFGIGIDTDINYHSSSSPGPLCIIENMPKLEEAYIDSRYVETEKFIRDFIRPTTCVKVLSLCLEFIKEEDLYREGIVFHQLEHLKLCSCKLHWSPSQWPELLARFLKDSPNLLELEIYRADGHISIGMHQAVLCFKNQEACGEAPTCSVKILKECVPECLSWSLETFKWTRFNGSRKEIALAKSILSNAYGLKTATILGLSSKDPKKKLEVIEELSLSTSCQLVFD